MILHKAKQNLALQCGDHKCGDHKYSDHPAQIVKAALLLAMALLAAMMLSGCGLFSSDDAASGQGQQLPAVKVAQAIEKDIPIYHEYVGEVSGEQDVAVRPRATGIILSQHFTEGGPVRQGQLLFRIDPREYNVSIVQAEAQLAAARAESARAAQDVARYKPLLEEDAIARQVYDNAVAVANANAAQVRAAKAVVDQAELARSYTEVRAPFSGQASVAMVEVGDLVSPGSNPLVRLSRSQTVEVYFSPSESELLEVRGRDNEGTARLARLILSDGSEYPLAGNINFADSMLDAATGTYRLRADFPNPQGVLTPGMFARVRTQFDFKKGAILVPDRAVIEQLGENFLMVVGKDGTVEQRQVTMGARVDGLWQVEKGIKAGETVIVEGIQKVRGGMKVKPVSMNASKAVAGADKAANSTDPAQ